MMKSAKARIIFPLDVSSFAEAKDYISLLSDHVGMFKVGLELFIRSGPRVVDYIHQQGSARVFLDLKLHDIPATVSRAMRQIAELGVDFATVHCGESVKMLEAAVQAGDGRVGVLGVTVLTSVAADDIRDAGFRTEFFPDISKLVVQRALAARGAGCAGVVCSGREAGLIKQSCGEEFKAVTPGVRPSWDDVTTDDQRRITTPAQAIHAGADYLVIGRPIRDAADPKGAADRIAAEIEQAACATLTTDPAPGR